MIGIALEKDERVLRITRKHWMIFARDGAGTVGIGILLFVLLGFISLPGTLNLQNSVFLVAFSFGEVLWVLLVWLALAVIWTNYYLDVWVVTNRRIVNVEQVKLFRRSVTTWQYKDIQEITIETKNFFETFFNYGSINIRTAGPTGAHARMEGIAHPSEVSALMMREMEEYQKLLEINKKQETLLRTVSHDIKGHLTKNEAAFASIAEGDYAHAPEKFKAMAKEALADTRSGVAMVMNVLSSSDFKTGDVQFKAGPFDFSNTVQKVVSEVKPVAEKKGLSLEYIVNKGSYIVSGDEVKIREHVIRNLVENAIHYTSVGSITVRLASADNAIVLMVSDTGGGISPEDLSKLFTEGGKGTNSTSVNPKSTGFGLFIARQTVEAHDGAIWAESEGVGHGSTFYMALPISPQKNPDDTSVKVVGESMNTTHPENSEAVSHKV